MAGVIGLLSFLSCGLAVKMRAMREVPSRAWLAATSARRDMASRGRWPNGRALVGTLPDAPPGATCATPLLAWATPPAGAAGAVGAAGPALGLPAGALTLLPRDSVVTGTKYCDPSMSVSTRYVECSLGNSPGGMP